MRVAILWTGVAGYLNACFRELASRPGVKLFVARSTTDSIAPFDENMLSWIQDKVVWKDARDFDLVQSRLNAFDPELVVVAGWHVPIYRRILKPLKGRCLRVMTMDNYWRGTLRQRAGMLVSAQYVLPMADAAWVPGVHQTDFARRLGFSPRNIVDHSLSADQPGFAAVYEQRIKSNQPLPRAFIFIGRLVAEKGVDTLIDAYQRYRKSSEHPWPLIVCGTGPLRSMLTDQTGVHLRGFVQPDALPAELAQAGCLLLPSNFEPWALVVNEATAAGLIIIASEKVGSIPHLIHNYFNGFVIEAGDADHLAREMIYVDTMDSSIREQMSQASYVLSAQYTPVGWADALLTYAKDHMVSRQ